jgi:DNA invertase Pin-like site-specific DNA recombinase
MPSTEPRLIGYARVSTGEQNTNLQLDALTAAGCCAIYEDCVSGTSTMRDGLDAALTDIQSGERLLVWRLDRLGRSIAHIMTIIARLEAKGASLVSLQESFDTGTESGQLYSTVLAMIAHVERRMIVARTRAGLQAARDRGQRLGGRPKMAPDQIAEARLMIDGGTKAEAVAARYNVARATLFRHLKSVRLHPPEPTVLG